MLLPSLGVNPDQTTTVIASDLDHLQAIGVKALWLVVDIAWAFPTSSTIDSTAATRLDACVNGAVSRGMDVALQVHGSPSWIVTSSGHTYPGNIWHGPDHATERSNWVTCLHNYLTRYAAGTIGWVEIWNEPNLAAFWNGPGGVSAADYMRLLHDCYVDIKASWPAIKVVGHNISRNDIGWIQDAYAWSDIIYGAVTSAASDYWHDVVGIHPYCGNSTSGFDPVDTSHADDPGSGGGVLDPDYLGYRRIYAEVIAKEGTAKPLAFGEFGYATQAGWFFVSEATRASYIASAMTLAHNDGYLDYFTIYYHRPTEAATNHDTSFNIHPSSGATSTETAFTATAVAITYVPAGLAFDGVSAPLIRVYAAFGGSFAPAADVLRLGVGPGLGTGKLGGGQGWVDITADVQVIRRELGRDSPTDQARVGTCVLTVDNRSGDYDPDNLDGPYVASVSDVSGTEPTLNYTQAGGPSSSGCTNSAVTMVAGGSLHDMGGASAATPDGTNPAVPAGTSTFWNDLAGDWQSCRWKLRPDLDTQVAGAGYFFINQGFLQAAAGGAGNVWYAGLQSQGVVPSPSFTGKIVNCSIWNAVAAVAGDLLNTYAGTFTGEGDGYRVAAPYPWIAGRTYTLACTADPARGDRWFAFHIRDETTGTQSWIGSIQAGTSDRGVLRGVCYHLTELFSQASPAATCPLLPRATTFFGTPTFSTSAVGASLVDIGTPVQVLAEYPPGTVYPRFYGEIADIAPDDGYDPRVLITCADGLEKLGRARLADTPFAPAFDGDTSGERIGHLADAAAWPSSLRALDTGYATLGPTTMGASALELMRKVEATEVGLLFVDGAGVLVFYDRHRTTSATRSTTVQASLTDTGGPGEVEMTSLQRAKSRERVVNDWHITRESGYIEIDIDGDPTDTDNPQEQVATDQVSVDKYGLLSGGQGLGPLLRFDEEALAMAQGLLPLHKTPQVRIREVTVDAITQGRWAQLLPLTLLDRISVARDYGPVTVAAQLLIQALAEEIRNDEQNAGWSFTFSTTNPTPATELFVLGTSQLGVDRLGW